MAATADEAIWRATALTQLPMVDVARLERGGRYSVLVRGDLNPLSEDLLADVRRWLVQPARGQRQLGTGDSFFGSFVSIFVNPRIEDSEHQVRFVSQTFRSRPDGSRRRRRAPRPSRRSPSRRSSEAGTNHEAASSGPLRVEDPGCRCSSSSLVPLGATAYLMSVTIGRDPGGDRAAPGGGPRTRWAGAVEVYRSYFAEMKETFRERANEIAAEGPIQQRQRAGRRPRPAARAHPRRASVVDEW